MDEFGHSHGGHRQRLRRRFENEGLSSFEAHEVLELLLYYSIPQKDTNPLAHKIIENFGGFDRALDADIHSLMEVDGVGYNTAVLIKLVREIFQYYSRSRFENGAPVEDCDAVGKSFCARIGMMDREVFAAAAYDAEMREIAFEVLSDGYVSQTEVRIRSIVEFALQKKAQVVILAHNHVYGAITPSQADRDTTREICRVMSRIGVSVADHIIVSGEDFYSFAKNNIMPM